jgi:hypothetical protein
MNNYCKFKSDDNKTIIDIFNFKSDARISPFAPEWDYFLAESQINNIDFSKIAEFLLKKEDALLKLPITIKTGIVDGYTGLGENSLTARYSEYNVFQFENELVELKELKKEIFNRYCGLMSILKIKRNKVWYQSWCNIIRKGEKMTPHIHSTSPYCYLSAHVTIQCNDTSTVYINPINQINEPETYNSPNKVGKLNIFQTHIPHYTTEHKSDKERITIALDFNIDEEYKLKNNARKRNMLLFDVGEIL